ncbi:MAG: PTS mannitol transporter subunit IICBA [Eubacteriales bacterium]
MKEKVQVFGRVLSGMVMPNIGAFIAWGIITALFIETGWLPNETFAELVTPMSYTLLPLLIAYTAGSNVHGHRGGVIATIATMGVVVGADVPMFLGAMIIGPLSALVIKKFDQAVEGKVKAGFEMLVNNFSIGIIGAILALVAMKGVTPVVTWLNNLLAAGVNVFVENGLLPLVSIFVEPAKILFLNNALNHGIFSPLGIQQVEEYGKSIFFLLESNPGPGLGILLAYCLVGKGTAKSTAPGAAIIHFLGGIHEIYFPYVLMNPLLLISAICGGASGVFIFSMFDVGLTSAASPGSIFALLAMCDRNSYLGLLLGVLVSTAVAFVISVPLLKFMGKDTTIEEAQAKKDSMKRAAKGIAEPTQDGAEGNGKITQIAFACDAGMGSSAMGATVVRKKIAAAGLEGIHVIHTSVSSIPAEIQLVVTHENLRERAAASNPNAQLVLITNFMNAPEYDQLIEDLKANHGKV